MTLLETAKQNPGGSKAPTAAIYTIILLDCIGNIRGLNSELVNRSVNFNKLKFKSYDHIALKGIIASHYFTSLSRYLGDETD